MLYNNSLADRGIDFESPSSSFSYVIFGECDPCFGNSMLEIGQTVNFVQTFVKDDDDLEFDHGFILEVVGPPDSIILPSPVQINITDDGMCVSYSLKNLSLSLISQNNQQLV